MPQASLLPAAHPSSLSTLGQLDPCWAALLAHLGVSLLLAHEAVGGQAQLGHARVPRVLHQRPDLVRPGDVVRGTGTGKGKERSQQPLRGVWLSVVMALSGVVTISSPLPKVIAGVC